MLVWYELCYLRSKIVINLTNKPTLEYLIGRDWNKGVGCCGNISVFNTPGMDKGVGVENSKVLNKRGGQNK